jgi:hypothetical protein
VIQNDGSLKQLQKAVAELVEEIEIRDETVGTKDEPDSGTARLPRR